MTESESSPDRAFRTHPQVTITEKIAEAQYDKNQKLAEEAKKSSPTTSLNEVKRPPAPRMTREEVLRKFSK